MLWTGRCANGVLADVVADDAMADAETDDAMADAETDDAMADAETRAPHDHRPSCVHACHYTVSCHHLRPFAQHMNNNGRKMLPNFHKLTKIYRLFPFGSECQAEGKYENC